MFKKGRLKNLLVMVIAVVMYGADAHNEKEGKPANDLPNPYTSVAPWGKLPDGRTWGAVSAVAIDNDGQSVWVANRCGENPETPPGASPYLFDSCSGSKVPPILKFDSAGKLLKSFGADMFIFPHRIYI